MIKIKLEKIKSGKIIFKLKINDIDKESILFKRAIMESKVIKGKSTYNYEVPLRYFVPICNNISKEKLIIDKKSIFSYLEFSDYYDQNYYTQVNVTPKYMKKWRDEGCPDIYRISINKNDYSVKKEVVFKKHKINIKPIDI